MVKYADGPRAEVTIEIDAPPAAVWALVTDVDLPARFSDELQGAEWIDGAEPALGSRFRGTNRHPLAGEWTTESTIVEFDPERAFAWAVGYLDDVAATWRFSLEPTGDGTRLTMSARMGPGPSGLTPAIEARPDREDDIVDRRLGEWRANMTATVEGMKELAEES